MANLKKLRSIFRFIDEHPLAGKHKLHAYLKFISWQLSQALFPKERVVPFVGKTRLSVKKGMAGATGNIYTGLHEFHDMGFLLHFLRSSDHFADVGANIGSYSILASAYVGATTIAFEPSPDTFMQLQKNIRLNDITGKVHALNYGVGSSEGKLQFTTGNDTVNYVVTHPKQFSGMIVEVDVVSLDKVLPPIGIPVLLKIDVEGFETEVIRGMSGILENPALKAIIIELNGSGGRYGYSEDDIHETLLKYGFRATSYDPFKRDLTILNEHGALNTIYVRDMEFILNRLHTSPLVKLFHETF